MFRQWERGVRYNLYKIQIYLKKGWPLSQIICGRCSMSRASNSFYHLSDQHSFCFSLISSLTVPFIVSLAYLLLFHLSTFMPTYMCCLFSQNVPILAHTIPFQHFYHWCHISDIRKSIWPS